MIEPCQHVRTEKRRRTLSNGVITVALQCLDCGSCLRSLPKAGEDVAAMLEFDPAIKTAYDQQWLAAAQVATEESSAEFWNRYQAYLLGPHWRQLRLIVLQRDPVCQVCFEERSVQAHHLSYESFRRYGFSFSTECVGVCYDCHFEVLHPGGPDA